MNTTAIPTNQCLECQAPLSPAETQGLCARCLLKLGLASQFGESSVADAGARKFVPPPMFPFDFGGYRVRRLLGRGGMGAVYEAEQHDTGRRVALKVLGHTIDSPEMRKRFLREGRLAASVNHPNSVYIFGTEEIDGAPVIAMELVAGGTLRDQVKKGPLAVREAVDAILHVIAGLEAAAGAGVLHRDVKPANCFVAPDGTVKVGDFGLSVSTLARHDSQLTASGMMLGTPSFAPPEQLRGDELDVRADIYSVGATLYALLTGHAPFEGDNAVQVVAAVLDKAPKPIGEFRKDVPSGLVQVVGKCLAKKRDERFANYAALRDALLPFSASVPEPAPLGLRFVAGLIDNSITALPNTVAFILLGFGYEAAFLSPGSPSAMLNCLAVIAFAFGYFAISEGRWGVTPGKALCGLRIIGPEGGAPGFARALRRAAIYVFALHASTWLHFVFAKTQFHGSMEWLHPSEFGTVIFWLLFVTIRRRNGFAALHELGSGTRTIARAKATARPRIEVPAPSVPDSAEGERLGPFRVLGPLADGALLAGYDGVLRRHVWIRPCAAGTLPIEATRREIGRAGRLRWLAGARADTANWDAFEAPPGEPLRELSAQSWASVRGWLQDLAGEIDAASKDGTLPGGIGLDHVWIAADGRAVLLDGPWWRNKERRFSIADPEQRRLQTAAPCFACAEPTGAQHFLSAIADAALDRSVLPLHARDFLEKLAAGAFDRVSFILGNLQSLLAKPASVSRRRRFAALALVPVTAMFTSLVMGLMMFGILAGSEKTKGSGPEQRRWHELTNGLNFYASARGEEHGASIFRTADVNAQRVDLAATYIGGHFGEMIQSPTFDRDAEAAGLDAHRRELARSAITAHPSVTPEQLKKADTELGRALQMMDGYSTTMRTMVGPVFFGALLLFISVGSLLGGLIFGFAPMLHVFGLAVVDRAGRPARRLRLLARSALVWGPLIGGWVAIFLINLHLMSGRFSTVWNGGMALFALSALGFLIGVPWTVLHPTRGPHDRLAGTRVVPR